MVQMNWFAGQKLRHRCREQTYGHQGAKAAGCGEGGVMNWEIGIDMYTLMCIKWMTKKNLLYKKINKIKFKNSKKKKKWYVELLTFRKDKTIGMGFLTSSCLIRECQSTTTVPNKHSCLFSLHGSLVVFKYYISSLAS